MIDSLLAEKIHELLLKENVRHSVRTILQIPYVSILCMHQIMRMNSESGCTDTFKFLPDFRPLEKVHKALMVGRTPV